MKRRDFIRITSLYSGGWILSAALPLNALAQTQLDPICFQPHPLIKLCDDGSIIIYVRKQEMGQGVSTSLPMIVAEEMEADWQSIKSEIAPFDYEKKEEYRTIASDSILKNWEPLRRAGAAAREMLMAAAAQRWSIEIKDCQAEKGKIINTLTNESVPYKELIAPASKLPVPETPPLKNYKDFRLIGKGAKRLNALEIVTGKTKFGIDVKLPGMLYALVFRSPVYGGKIKSYNAERAKKIDGVKHIVEIKEMDARLRGRNGIAVVADSFWTAQKARNVLEMIWEDGINKTVTSDGYSKKLKQVITEPPIVIIEEKGNSDEVFKSASAKLEADYEFPFLAHATIEPPNCTATYKDGNYELWGGFQIPGNVADMLPALFGVKRENIKINLTPMGGGFGRRASIDNASEAMQIAKAIEQPVKVYWTRTDDIQNDAYRPAMYHKLSASLNQDKNILSWQDRVSGTPFLQNIARINIEAIGGLVGDFYYPVENFKSSFHFLEPPIPCGAWRSVAYSHNNFAVECFVDELAANAGIDPFDYRLQLLSKANGGEIQTKLGGKLMYSPERLIAVLRKVAEEIGWHHPHPKGHHLGIACCPYLTAKSYAAHAFDISVDSKRKITIHKVVAAIDCGLVIDLDGVQSQMQGALAWGLSAALREEITLQHGRVQQSNLKNYGVLRFNEMPAVKVHIIDSKEDPGSVGEVGVPSVAPALCNAIFAATKYRIRKLPISNVGFRI
ncbi:MAG TPA: molybdopterin cofactor-binding domain-containing protein [Chitinophagaceae bacterium]